MLCAMNEHDGEALNRRAARTEEEAWNLSRPAIEGFREARDEPRGTDGAMDRRVAKPRAARIRQMLMGAGALALASIVIYSIVTASRSRSLTLAADSVTISTVRSGVFNDYVPIRGSVTPLRTVYLDAMEGGRVDALMVEEGAAVTEGQPIIELSNTALQLDVISREAQVSEQVNNLRNTRLALEQNRLALRNELTEIDYHLTRLGKLAERRAQLAKAGLISRQDSEDTADELAYYRLRRSNTLESQKTDELMREAQISRLESTVEQLQKNLVIARRNLEGLVVKAPFSGQLTSLDAQIGESKARGQRLGQIDDLEGFKVTAQVDEFYLNRLRRDQVAQFELGGQTHSLQVTKIYPEVRDGKFDIDLRFDGPSPQGLRRGQTLQLRLAMGDSTQALLLANGGFFQDTGGNWVFVLDAAGEVAVRRDVRLGRRNPEHVEVLGGLREGERVIVSTYSTFLAMDRLALSGRP
jgi:HlyD family secretion protein